MRSSAKFAGLVSVLLLGTSLPAFSCSWWVPAWFCADPVEDLSATGIQNPDFSQFVPCSTRCSDEDDFDYVEDFLVSTSLDLRYNNLRYAGKFGIYRVAGYIHSVELKTVKDAAGKAYKFECFPNLEAWPLFPPQFVALKDKASYDPVDADILPGLKAVEAGDWVKAYRDGWTRPGGVPISIHYFVNKTTLQVATVKIYSDGRRSQK